jgi:hypothetical protein
VAEDQEVLRAGLAAARWITVDDPLHGMRAKTGSPLKPATTA